MAAQDKSSSDKTLATNRKVRRDYHVIDSFEAGIELRGTEVKSMRQGNVTLGESYALVDKRGDVLLMNMHINPYDHGNVHNHEPNRPRRLLLHRREIARLYGQTAVQGHALIPLKAYLKHGLVKIELGLCKGKQVIDKRETIKRRTADREAERALAHRSKRRR